MHGDSPTHSFSFPLRPAACRIFVPRPGMEPTSPALEARSLNHWTAREVPLTHSLPSGESHPLLVSVFTSIEWPQSRSVFQVPRLCIFGGSGFHSGTVRSRRLGRPLPGEKGEQKNEVPRRPRSQVGRRAVAEGRRQRGRIPSREADGKEWPPGGMAGRPAATITGPAVERDATSRTPASAENETGELMSSGGAKDAFVLIPPAWEQPEKGERAGARAGQLGPHSGAWPAGQLPAGASRQA